MSSDTDYCVSVSIISKGKRQRILLIFSRVSTMADDLSNFIESQKKKLERERLEMHPRTTKESQVIIKLYLNFEMFILVFIMSFK